MTIRVYLGDLRYNYSGVLANDCMPLGVAYMKAVMDREDLPRDRVAALRLRRIGCWRRSARAAGRAHAQQLRLERGAELLLLRASPRRSTPTC